MKTRKQHPVTRGVADVPVVMQLETLECGAACLAMVLAYYRKWIPLERIRIDCGVSRNGSNARNIISVARYYGLDAAGFRCEPQELRSGCTFPCIIHWTMNHFVVLCGFRGNRAYINDPSKGAYSIPMETFDECFTGICLRFEPSDRFEPFGRQKSILSFAAKRLSGMKSAVIFAILTALITSFIGILNPAFSRVFLDRLLPHRSPQWFIPFLIMLGAVDVIEILMSAINDIWKTQLNGKLDAIGNSSYMWKVLRMPIEFFSQRMAGDIQERQTANASVANTIIDTLAPLVFNAFMMILYLVIMVRYSWILTLIGVVSLLLTAFVSQRISKKRINITRRSARESARLTAATIAGIDMIETIKANGAENGFFEKWSGFQATSNSQNVKFINVDRFLGVIPGLIAALASDLVLVAGVYLAMNGEFTVGMIMAFQGFFTSFMSPAGTMISAGQTLQEMRTQMERIDDVMEYPTDDTFAADDISEDFSKLSGHIELRDIVFGYAPLSSPLINGLNLEITPGSSVAIVGFSGCGKSTISKLISGLHRPWSGEVLFDGKPLCEISKNVFTGSLAVVDQDIVLFEDTVANNIKMWDSSIEDFEMILAARDARIHDDIMQRSGGYQHLLLDGGRDFSGGQRQQLEIARVLAQDPSIIILDEATSALDARTEHEVVDAIRSRGITCIIIAHRLSTIRSCDEIIVMDSGTIIGRGTHDELMKTNALYSELVTSE